METVNIRDYITPGRRAHLVGVGGVSMSPLAEVLHGMGMEITGSDMNESAAVAHLRSLGIPVAIGHRGENVQGAELVIRTAAVHDDNPEIARAHAQGIPVFERAQAWGALMRGYKNALCIAGTHGKTTTTSMCTHIGMAAGVDPTVMIGGTLPLLGAGHRVGKGDTIIAESCEYCNSFLSFAPTVAVILNVEEDHLDFFQDLDDIKASFRRFAELVPAGGRVIVNADNAGARSVAQGLDPFTFGLEEGAACTARNLHQEDGCPVFDICVHDALYAHVKLQVHGRHNISNALAAAAAAYVLNLPGRAVEEGLGAFTGAGRRFEKKGTCNGADVYDDYAHHPDELRALLTMSKELGYRRVICAFQPHTYSRTEALFDDFAEVLRLPDVTLLAEIFAARESNEHGITSRTLAEHVPGSQYFPTLEALTEHLRTLAQPGDLILTVGAGDIYTVGEALTSH
ncbi:MAG: UDP-N-acetylmuramate--L-alanine ligase [Flavonifractor sp.]|nr:UDP-N-acetylmuramate--L-alanine ligase [Flavonifractor sp.]